MWWSVSKSYTPFLFRNCDFQAYGFGGVIFVAYNILAIKPSLIKIIFPPLFLSQSRLNGGYWQPSMWNWASGKKASSLVSSLHHKSVVAFLQTSLNLVILFLRLLILRYLMMGLLVYNFLKFISSSMSRLCFVFLALLLIWLAMLSCCFLKFALKELILFT